RALLGIEGLALFADAGVHRLAVDAQQRRDQAQGGVATGKVLEVGVSRVAAFRNGFVYEVTVNHRQYELLGELSARQLARPAVFDQTGVIAAVTGDAISVVTLFAISRQ